RWPALHHVADVDLVAGVAHRGDHLREELAGGPDEGDALVVVLGARSFADEHQARLGISHTEDEILPARAELAALAVTERLPDLVESGRFLGARLGSCGWLDPALGRRLRVLDDDRGVAGALDR